ncbi:MULTISPECIES: hypothetical protein [Thermoactinomyces]|jgi:hypothetical protein|uniref:Uncharacterized protein n=1 Tax=Thermoactinomyces daqus TaxID=1329516 RepID=A0A7W1X9E6_9BACL|nr:MULTISPECIES: hypothetical protein [Thermoactinomyces]MBA4542394.1 hypothetical protein [Thermoactinomyces daqus]MBH8598817.1 hypothetical protein [Thermoactinomyces sp. CICC 10523]MBH8604802.1 hypothetical protein [Thermoactinomyces sp. CICC 10522]MBH8607372.1 hypothetical protein [Thermoactinomyces sp. CICC 10521]
MMLLIAFASNGIRMPIFTLVPAMNGSGNIYHGKIPYSSPCGGLSEKKVD